MRREHSMRSGRGLSKQRIVVLLLILSVHIWAGGCSSPENERSNNRNDPGQDVGQQDVGELEDVALQDAEPADVDEPDVSEDVAPPLCVEDALRCSASGHVEVCEDGAWQAQETCLFGCAAGACLEEVECNAGHVRCNESNVEICNAEGSAYLHVTTCAEGCFSGLCAGGCTPGETRCNGADVETCNAIGSGWDVTDSCGTYCAVSQGQCALSELTVSAETMLNGTVFVDGPVVVQSGALLHSPEGNLTIYARSITVESGAVIDVAAKGQNTAGRGADGRSLNCEGSTRTTGGRGGSYGTQAPFPRCHELGQTSAIYGSDYDAFVEEGSPGGNSPIQSGGFGGGGLGGGVIRLIADTIRVEGDIRANGGTGQGSNHPGAGTGGGGSGGGVLLAADHLTVTGNIETKGGQRGISTRPQHEGSDGGNGRIKLLYGSHGEISGTFIGATTQGVLPPVALSSPTHPDPKLVYNDDFDAVAFTWEKPFPGVAGYYFAASKTQYAVPTDSDTQVSGESKVLPGSAFATSGTHYFHIASVNAAGEVSTVESNFAIRINTLAPLVVSESNPDKNAWYEAPLATFAWTVPQGDENVRNFYYVFDQYGDTVPTLNDTMLPGSQRDLTLSPVGQGIWSFHLIASDTQGRLTKRATHYRVKVGEDRGNGSVSGTIVDQNAQPVQGATVTVNRGLLLPETPNATSNAAGSFHFARVPAGSWELRVSAPGYETRDVAVQVDADQPANIDLTLNKL